MNIQSLAIDQIKSLKASYFSALDAKRWDEFARLFAPNCEFVTYKDAGNTLPKRRCGRDEIVASVRRTIGDASTLHQGQLLAIQFPSPERATAVWKMTDYAEIGLGTARRILRGAGHYDEQYRLLDGIWTISRLELKRTSLVVE